MSEIPTKIEKMGSTSSLTPWKHPELGEKNGWPGFGEEEGELIYSGQVSTGWRHQQMLNLSFSTSWSH
jgi:hypothetical protein